MTESYKNYKWGRAITIGATNPNGEISPMYSLNKPYNIPSDIPLPDCMYNLGNAYVKPECDEIDGLESTQNGTMVNGWVILQVERYCTNKFLTSLKILIYFVDTLPVCLKRILLQSKNDSSQFWKN